MPKTNDKKEARSQSIDKHHSVKLHYKGTLDDGEVFDSSEEKEPLEFITGTGMVIKGFDDAVIGMKTGEEKTFSIEPKEAYGEKIKELVQEVPKEAFGDKFSEIQEGQTLGIRGPHGHVMPAKVTKITSDKVTLDLNHPLAGQRLTFKINVVDSKKLSEEEIEALNKQSHSCDSCGDDHDDEGHGHSCGGGCC